MPRYSKSTLNWMGSVLRKRGYRVALQGKSLLTEFGAFFKPLKFLTAGIGAAYFYLFILEEAAQTSGFGVFVLMQKKLWKEAGVQNRRYRDIAVMGLNAANLFALEFLTSDNNLSEEEYQKAQFGVVVYSTPETQQKWEDSQGILELVFMPFTEFFSAAIETSEMYDAAIAGETQQAGPAYKKQLDILKKQFADDKFKLRLAHDERLDKLKIEKAERADELAVAKKREENELASDIKAEFKSELIDAIQAIRRLLDDDLENVNSELNTKLSEIRQKLSTELKDAAEAKIDMTQLMYRNLDNDIEKVAQELNRSIVGLKQELIDELQKEKQMLDDVIGEILKRGKEKEITKEEADALERQARADASDRQQELRLAVDRKIAELRVEAEDRKDGLRIEAQEKIQSIRADPSNAAGILKDSASKKIAELRSSAEQSKDAFRQSAEEAIQAQRKASFEAGQKGKLTPRERADKKLVIKIAYDKKDLVLKSEFDERDRAEKEIHDSALDTMEKIFQQNKAELRQKFFPAKLSRMEVEELIGKDTTQFNAVVERVVDADTIIVKGFYVRLLGINAAEADTEEGQENKKYLKGLIEGKVVTIKTDPANKFDHFDRMLGMIFLGDANISLHMLETCRAFLFTLGENALVDKEAFGAAAMRCLSGSPPAVAVPEVPPVVEATPAPAEQATLTIQIRRPGGRTDGEADVNIGGTSKLVSPGSSFSRAFPKGDDTRVIIRTFGDILIAPLDSQLVDVIVAVDADKSLLFDIGTIEELHPPIPIEEIPLPADVDGLTGLSHSVEFGLLDPPQPLGLPQGQASFNIIPRREFKIDELADTSHEIIGFRLNINQAFTNTEVMDFEEMLLRPDNTTLITPEGGKLQTPSSQGISSWAWAKFVVVWNGNTSDLRGKGIYKYIFRAISGGVMQGQYEGWFKVI